MRASMQRSDRQCNGCVIICPLIEVDAPNNEELSTRELWAERRAEPTWSARASASVGCAADWAGVAGGNCTCGVHVLRQDGGECCAILESTEVGSNASVG